MIDFEKIGKRILEERKYLRRISQEKMAEDLGMYQADIGNLEKAKNGSGITDLAKLDMIADYFEMPLETLLFGRRQDKMEKYQGSKMQLKVSSKKRTQKHETILSNLMGLTSGEDNSAVLDKIKVFECGPYLIYAPEERQYEFGGQGKVVPGIIKPHLYVIYQDEVIACMTAFSTTVMQHVFQPAFERLKNFIFPDIFDLNDTLQTLNPYWLLYQYSEDEKEMQDYRMKMMERMDELRGAGEDRTIFYVESAYVREDCRQNGILRMMLDVLRELGNHPLIWLCLEPTSGDELRLEYSYYATYEPSQIGQLNLNASIAEHLGFTIDQKTERRYTEKSEEDGTPIIRTEPVRRTAYYLPKSIRDILSKDGDLLAYARARAKALGTEDPFSDLDEDDEDEEIEELFFIENGLYNSPDGCVMIQTDEGSTLPNKSKRRNDDMKDIKEISRRIRYHIETGFTCGPIGMQAIEAEITVEVDGEKVYLLGQWEDMYGEYNFEATKESLYDILEKDYTLGSDEEKAAFDELDRIREGGIEDDEDFKPFYKELKKMIREERKAHS